MTKEEFLRDYKSLRDDFDRIVVELNDLHRGIELFQEIADNLASINEQIGELGSKLDDIDADVVTECQMDHCEDGNCHGHEDCDHSDCGCDRSHCDDGDCAPCEEDCCNE